MQIMVPVRAELYRDLVRMSDGAIIPEDWIEHGFLAFLETTYLASPEWFDEKFGDRAEEFISTYLASVADNTPDYGSPLFWKAVTVPAGSEVKMTYAGRDHFAVIRDGAIIDADERFTPSEWASHVARGTSRNAWRDLWFKLPGRSQWILAQALRKSGGPNE